MGWWKSEDRIALNYYELEMHTISTSLCRSENCDCRLPLIPSWRNFKVDSHPWIVLLSLRRAGQAKKCLELKLHSSLLNNVRTRMVSLFSELSRYYAPQPPGRRIHFIEDDSFPTFFSVHFSIALCFCHLISGIRLSPSLNFLQIQCCFQWCFS